MTQRDGFLNAIVTEPDDDAHRLIFADWLDDHGESDRAELIRVQIESARLPEGDPHAADLDTRSEELLAEHENEWLGEWSQRLVRWTFRRGFLDEITIEPELFLRHGEELFQRFPVFRIRFVGSDGNGIGMDAIPEVVACPWMGRVRSLDASFGFHSGGMWAHRVARARHLTGLQELKLHDEAQQSTVTLDRAGLADLCAAPHLASLQRLDIGTEGNNPLGDAAVQLIAGATFGKRLRSLVLDGQEIGDTGARRLAGDPVFKSLDRLHLAGCRGISPECALALLSTSNLSRLTDLCLGCRVHLSQIAALNVAPPLTRLDLWAPQGMVFSSASWSAFARSPLASLLTHLGLADGILAQDSVHPLLEPPGLPSLRGLALWGGDAGELILRVLARGSRQLASLSLTNCGVTDRGIHALAVSPLLRGLTHLRLWRADTRNEAVTELIKSSLWTSRLKRLELRYADLREAFFRAFAECHRLAGMTYLDLTSSDLSLSGIVELLNSPHLRRLTTLRLDAGSNADVLYALAHVPGWPRLRELVISSRADDGAVAALRQRFGPRLIVYPDT